MRRPGGRLAALFLVAAMLATTASKRILLRDPDVLPELILYFLLVVILLAVRIPMVRQVILTVGRKRPFQLSTD